MSRALLAAMAALTLLACTKPDFKAREMEGDPAREPDAGDGEDSDDVDESVTVADDDKGEDDSEDEMSEDADTEPVDDGMDGPDASTDGLDAGQDAGDDGMDPDEDDTPPCEGELCPKARLTVVIAGDGRGTVSFGGVTCSGNPCVKELDLGHHVITANVTTPNTTVKSWDAPGCSGTSCDVELSGDTTVTVRFELRYNVAFASRLMAFGEFNSPAAADALCAAEARAADIHGTTFRAFVSSDGPTSDFDDDIHAIDRLAGTGGWVNLDGYPVALAAADLVSPGPLYPIMSREFIDGDGNTLVFTGSDASGHLRRYQGNSQDCHGWQDPSALAMTGRFWATNAEWTYWAVVPCAQAQARLYCFGVDAVQTVPRPTTSGRKMFVSTKAWNPASGRSAADALCAANASAAGLDGEFQAFLGTSTQPAAERFTRTGSTWVRMDGTPWVASPSELGTFRGSRSSARFLASGSTLALDPSDYGTVLTGGAGSLSSYTCSDWSSSDGSAEGGKLQYAGPFAWQNDGALCNEAARVYCLEK